MATPEQVDAAVALLRLEGVLVAGTEELARKLLNNLLGPDYIPRNPLGDCGGAKDMTNIRLALPGTRCARAVGNDIQSGPIYCGRPAVVFADSIKWSGAVYVLCRRCATQHVGIKIPERQIHASASS